MNIEGSCHCQAVRFRARAYAPYPYLRCYCSICRKVAGGGGYAINIGADAGSLEVEGAEHLRVYDAKTRAPGTLDGPGRRFCVRCASALWNFDPGWPELFHPFASCIDTELPPAPVTTHMMLGSRASWVPVHSGEGDERFDAYPQESLADWHAKHAAEG